MLEANNALEARTAELRHVEAELESVRQSHYAAGDGLHAAQGLLAEAALEVSRLEERIRYVADGRQRVQQRLAELTAQTAQWTERQGQAHTELASIDGQTTVAEAHATGTAQQVDAFSASLPGLEAALRQAQGDVGTQRSAVASVQQEIQVLAAEGRSTEEQRRQLQARRDRLDTESKQLAEPDLAHLADLRQRFDAAGAGKSAAEASVARLGDEVAALDEARRASQARVNAETGRQTELGARLAAQRALQEKVQVEGKLKPWLARHGLDSLQGLWTRLHIEPGWEAALEAALRERIGALQVGRLETVQAFAADAPPVRLAFYTPPSGAIVNTHRTLPRLTDLLRLGDAGLEALLNDWLEGVYTATDLDAALAARSNLTHGEIIMTREGHAVSQYAVSFYAPDTEQAGLLARAQEIENLDRQARAQAVIADEARGALVRSEAAYTDASQRIAAARHEAADAQSRAHQLQVELLRLSQQAEQTGLRREQLTAELATLDGQLGELARRRAAEEQRFEELDGRLGAAQERHAELEEAQGRAEQSLGDARQKLRELERVADEARFALRTLASRRAELERAEATAAEQIAANARSDAALHEELASLTDDTAQAGLQQMLAVRLEREATLGARRSTYDDLSAKLRSADEQRMVHEQSLDPLRERITKLQLEEQAAQLGGQQYMDQLREAAADLEAIAASIAAGPVKLSGLQGEIDRLNQEISALGAVNLAALEELGQARERKAFLDAQNADLAEAMSTLENAIRKIDLETRELLATTFDQVNEHFGRMFPSLFGGGNARLVMTGDEILDAGVQVMAQPPGKKNSTIHLLSGGEKALTAIALVFAIFQLNPAPFCLLDEVDAPLDDANTERYSNLVKEMATGTQFLFISHNKIAMEMAEQLIGVTMQEQGVSRIVTVDMPAAISLAEAA